MKRILIFIGLKIVEILGACGIIAIAYYIGQYYLYLGLDSDGSDSIRAVILGFASLFVCFAIGIGIYAVLKANGK